jgi:hypothetical protein
LTTAIASVMLVAPALSAPDNYQLEVVEYCDYVEINHVYRYDEIEERVICSMKQAIFWSFREEVLLPIINSEGKPTDEYRITSDFVIRDFVVLKTGWSNKQNVKWHLINGKWHFTFDDMNSDTYLRVICGSMKVTHTDYDVERRHLKMLKKDFRREFMERRK